MSDPELTLLLAALHAKSFAAAWAVFQGRERSSVASDASKAIFGLGRLLSILVSASDNRRLFLLFRGSRGEFPRILLIPLLLVGCGCNGCGVGGGGDVSCFLLRNPIAILLFRRTGGCSMGYACCFICGW